LILELSFFLVRHDGVAQSKKPEEIVGIHLVGSNCVQQFPVVPLEVSFVVGV
jgi:hypothetical protein